MIVGRRSVVSGSATASHAVGGSTNTTSRSPAYTRNEVSAVCAGRSASARPWPSIEMSRNRIPVNSTRPMRLDTTDAGTTNRASVRPSGSRTRRPGWAQTASRAVGMPTVNTVRADALRSSMGKVTTTSELTITRPRVMIRVKEQLEDVLHPVEDALALGDRLRDGSERVLHQHEVGDAARRLRAAAHRDGEVGLLEREHVVHAVADHRDVVAARAQRVHEALLLRRRDAAEDDRVARGRARARRRPAPSSSGPERSGIVRAEAGLAREGRDGLRVVARDDLHRDAARPGTRRASPPPRRRSSSESATRPSARIPSGSARGRVVLARLDERRGVGMRGDQQHAQAPVGPVAASRTSAPSRRLAVPASSPSGVLAADQVAA